MKRQILYLRKELNTIKDKQTNRKITITFDKEVNKKSVTEIIMISIKRLFQKNT